MIFEPPLPPPLRTKEAILVYLSEVIDSGDPKLLVAALPAIAVAARKLPPKAAHASARVGG